jgi:hypothetical protein
MPLSTHSVMSISYIHVTCASGVDRLDWCLAIVCLSKPLAAVAGCRVAQSCHGDPEACLFSIFMLGKALRCSTSPIGSRGPLSGETVVPGLLILWLHYRS